MGNKEKPVESDETLEFLSLLERLAIFLMDLKKLGARTAKNRKN